MRALSVCLGLALLVSPALSQSSGTLWCSDDVGLRIFNVSLDGSVVYSSFHSGSISGLAVDPADGTLWAAKEGWSRIVHFDRQGNELAIIESLLFDAEATRPEGIAVDHVDGTLWVVDDVTARVYNLLKNGTLIKTFSADSFDPLATSMQAIASDPIDGTLWITDNDADTIYNITTDGALIAAFPTSTFAAGVINSQGINVDETDGSLWITDRPTARVYHVGRGGVLISSFDTTPYGSFDPTGVTFDKAPAPVLPDLRLAGAYGVLGTKRIKIVGTDASVTGHVALAPGAKQKFKTGAIDGTLFVDPTADNTKANTVTISGGTIAQDLSQAAADMLTAADEMEAFPATQTFDVIKSSTAINGAPGLNVINVGKLQLKGTKTLTLIGGPFALFVINVEKKFALGGNSAIVLQGGVDPRNVIFNVLKKKTVKLGGNSTMTGTILSAHGGKINVSKNAVLTGSVLATGDIAVKKAARIEYFGDS